MISRKMSKRNGKEEEEEKREGKKVIDAEKFGNLDPPLQHGCDKRRAPNFF